MVNIVSKLVTVCTFYESILHFSLLRCKKYFIEYESFSLFSQITLIHLSTFLGL